MGWCDSRDGIAVVRCEDVGHCVGAEKAEADFDAETGDRADHLLAERRRTNDEVDLVIGVARPFNRSQSAGAAASRFAPRRRHRTGVDRTS